MLALLALSGIASATTIDFDNLSLGCNWSSSSVLTTQYASQGVTFSNNWAAIDECGNFGLSGHSSPNFLGWNTSTHTQEETLTFSPPTSSVSFVVGSSQSGSMTATAYDSNGVSLGSSTVTIVANVSTVSLPYNGIAEVVITTTARFGGLDDLSFAEVALVDDDGDGYTTADDCDDTDPSINPGATELVVDGVDQDCDGGDLCYEDLDGDTFGSTATVAGVDLTCLNSGESDTDDDCDDDDPDVWPNAPEVVADGVDQSCDGGDGCWEDVDGDGVGVLALVRSADLDCDDPGESADSNDCDDADAGVYPGAPESCDEVDQDCDSVVDEESIDAPTWYDDVDNDGYGDSSNSLEDCTQPTGYADNDQDCDDARDSVHPGATEICNEVDEDCDDQVDEDALDAASWYQDEDGDGVGGSADIVDSCDQPSGYVTSGGDCDDGDAAVWEAADCEEDTGGLVDETDGGLKICGSVPGSGGLAVLAVFGLAALVGRRREG